ncbi:hypothetical protein JRO89_XS09G0005100 [Xanthoceras sorbifolium]|uniref:Small ribosomal subunit protein uS15c n=1 Tax=Xanthoceras sorbifolium TaxID=99658 RepID=A0ABQ8HJZ4_9ROSI|nr:hypothetical protein JRO89_XS09G0005100 [Xanthoceras sorbifolium]
MALHHLSHRPKHRFLNNPSLIHLFSTSQNDNDDKNDNKNINNNNNKSSLNSYFSDVKASLKNQTTQKTPYPSPSSSLEEIRKNLAEYRQRSAAPPPPRTTDPNSAASQSQPISFQELFKRNHNQNQSSEVKTASGKPSFEAIRESMRRMRPNSNTNTNSNATNVSTGHADSLSRLAFKNSLKSTTQGGSGSRVIGGTQGLPVSVFGREMKGGQREGEGMKTDFMKMYSYVELGEKLRQLRPEGKKSRGEFSLVELNERLIRLREMEKDNDSRIGGVPYRELRESLQRLKISGEEKQQKPSMRLDILGHLGGTPSFMLYPPKEHLVEKASYFHLALKNYICVERILSELIDDLHCCRSSEYFHPDNLSSAEKMKIELAKVRDEFKMSESDCGSARVQVAQLTTKIKHLSSALHKKDKHSRKGLQAMVQRRKRLLKYLRRTDWDSYIFVLSKLGLRDNPDYKA